MVHYFCPFLLSRIEYTLQMIEIYEMVVHSFENSFEILPHYILAKEQTKSASILVDFNKNDSKTKLYNPLRLIPLFFL